MPRVIHFEIPADNPDRAVRFYSDVFGWQFNKWEGPVEYWLITTGADGQPGINGGMLRRAQPAPAPSTPSTFHQSMSMSLISKRRAGRSSSRRCRFPASVTSPIARTRRETRSASCKPTHPPSNIRRSVCDTRRRFGRRPVARNISVSNCGLQRV